MSKSRPLTLTVVALLALWAFWTPGQKQGAVASSQSSWARSSTAGRKYTIRVAPGGFYMPGTLPMSVGKPLEGFARVVEKFETLYPDTHVELVGVPGVREWLVTQLSAGLAPDIINANVEDVWQDIQKGWYIPLDSFLEKPTPFARPGQPGSRQWWDVFKYQAISRGKAAPDGKMYCLTLDMVETGIYYNKDIFRKLGLAPPKDWVEFLEIQKKIRQAGYIPLLTSLPNITDWGVDLLFDQFYRDILPGIDVRKEDPVRAAYLQGYLDWDEIAFLFHKGFFTHRDPRWIELWKTLKQWKQHFNKDITTADNVKLFLTQKSPMFWDGSWTVHKLTKDPDVDFDWGVFYLPPIPQRYCRFASGHDMVVIGGSANQFTLTNSAVRDTATSATSERLKRCVAFLQLLTTPECTNQVVNEVSVFLPNVVGVEPHKELEVFDQILHRRYTTTKWQFTFDNKFNEIMVRMLDLYLNDGISLEGYMEWMENNLGQAVANTERRKHLDYSRLEAEWRRMANEREKMKELPVDAR